MKNCFVYQHIRLDTGGIFYIGIGRSYSYKKYARAYNKHFRNNLWHKIVNKAGYKWEILYEGLTVEEAKNIEIMLIEKYGRIDLKTGILCNMTKGGDGLNDFKHSLKTKQEASKRMIKFNKEGKNPRIGSKHSEESKERMRIAKLGKKHTKEQNYSQSVNRSNGIYEIFKNGEYLGSFYSCKLVFEKLGFSTRSIFQLAKNNKIGHHGKIKGIKVNFIPKTDKK